MSNNSTSTSTTSTSSSSSSGTDVARYDRQLRLWGEGGQGLLEAAHLCLLNATATGTETLKNLVLPGIGKFTVVDGSVVSAEDENNFFVVESALGQSRAAVTCRLLLELNGLVSGEAVNKDPVQVIDEDLSFFKNFSLVIANSLPDTPLLKLSRYCWENKIPLVVTRAYGLLGYLRIAIPEHTVVESKPDNPPDDLRLTDPFPELAKYSASFNFETMNSTEHSHTPYIVILLQNFAKWRAEHGDQIPSNYAEKSQFRNQVISGTKKSDEENFNEAYKAALKACTPYAIPGSVQEILADPQAMNLTAESSNFWIMVAALKEFVANEGNGKLPLSGKLPDMTASTEGYISLQKVFQEKALSDATAISNRVKAILTKLGRPENSISDSEIKNFCKNSNFLQCFRFRSLDEEYNPTTCNKSLLASELSNPESNVAWYLALRAAFQFYEHHKRYAGSSDDSTQEDAKELNTIAASLLKDMGLTVDVPEKHLREMVRFGAAELHPIAALVGGIASQEIIKLLTHQYTPLNNCLIFNGIESTSISLEC